MSKSKISKWKKIEKWKRQIHVYLYVENLETAFFNANWKFKIFIHLNIVHIYRKSFTEMIELKYEMIFNHLEGVSVRVRCS